MASSMIVGMAVTALSATAATAATTAATPNTDVQEVIVTGTRIKGVTNAENPSPISSTSAQEIQLTKAISVEDVLQRMTGPDATGGLTSASNNGGVGISSIGLRNLGPTRTLVLVDGQRLIPIFTTTAAIPDLNSVPISMVDRIDVLRDGASSLYGADAIGGVINIITKRNANGMTFNSSVGESGHGDGLTYSMDATIAVNSDKGNVMLGVGWDHTDAVQQSARAWAVNPHLNDPNFEGGSVDRSQLDILQDTGSTTVWANGVAYTNSHNPAIANLAPNLVYLPGAGKVKLNSGGPGWNDLTGGQDRKQISINGHYNITDNIRFVASGFFTDRTSNQSLRPEPLLGTLISTPVFAGFIVPDYAPGNTTGSDIIANLTPVQFGPRTYLQRSETYRIRVGLEGTIGDKWDWEAGYVDQENSTKQEIANSGRWDHLAQITGQTSCVNVPGGCSPNTLPSADPHSLQNGGPAMLPTVMPNFFNGPNMFTAAQLDYLRFTSVDTNRSYERYFYANITGPLFDLPWANSGTVKGAFGAEYRKEFLSDSPDPLAQEGYAANPGLNTAGGYNVGAIYGELNVPLLKGLPLVQSLVVTPSVRYDHYSTFGGAWTGKFGVNYQVTEDIRFRASYSTGFRAPSVSELFGGQAISDIIAHGDPCDTRDAAHANGNVNSGTGLTASGSQCAKALAGIPTATFTGGALTAFNSPNNVVLNNQEQALIGGNPNLKPEQSVDWGLGLVFTPRFVPGLSFEVDYYNDKITNAILAGGIGSNAGLDLILNGCYGTAQSQNFCNLIQRSKLDGTITQINSLNDNFGTEVVHGIDYQLTYDTAAAHWNLPFPGSFKFDMQLSHLLKHTTQNPGAIVTTNNFEGTFQATSNEAIQPRWKGVFSVDYKNAGWMVHWDARYIQHMIDFGNAPNDHTFGDYIPDVWYNDLSVSYQFEHAPVVKTARVTVGIDNLFDKDPPFLGVDAICKCNSLAGPYDFVGRFFYGRLSTTF